MNITDLQNSEENTINLREELEKYLIYWRWFILSAIVSLIIAFLFLRYSTSVFSSSATIMIKDNKNSGISTELAAFEDLGIIGGASANNPENEVEIIKSRKIIGYVVDSLNLTRNYFRVGNVKNSELYRTNPFYIDLNLDTGISLDTVFYAQILDPHSFKLLDINHDFVDNGRFGKKLHRDGYSFILERIDSILLKKYDLPLNILISIKPRNKTIDDYLKKINVKPISKNSSVLRLTLQDAVPLKANAILNEIVKQYNYDAIADKNQVSRKTKIFIDDRLKKIGLDLANIQDRVTNYKDKNKITGLSKEAELALESVLKNSEQLIELNTELSLAKWVKKSLKQMDSDILPENLGFTDPNISKSIGEFNKLVLQRNKLALTAGDKNPNLVQLNAQIYAFKKSLIASIDNLIYALKNNLRTLRIESDKLNSKVESIPIIERGYIDIARQQEIISELYTYLLKKKEETDISLAVTVPKAKIIDYAYSNGKPVSPKKKIIYLAALLSGLLIPFVIIYIINLLDTKIHTKKDLDSLTSIPYLGDVPHSDTEAKIVVDKSSRTSTSEAFRLIRTNLGFILSKSKNEKGQTIFITSTTSGEGKSFISINLAAALSLSNKKVLLMGMDLRAPKVTEYLGLSERIGITNYITNENVTIDELKFQIPEIAGLDIISSGVIPPNPAELLLTDRVSHLYAQVQNDYDFVIVDTAPVNLVTDTLLMSKYADMTVYVTRANYLDKRMIAVPETLYQEKKLPNMAIILNDTDISRGYGYGYGYGYVQQEQKAWYKRLLGIK